MAALSTSVIVISGGAHRRASTAAPHAAMPPPTIRRSVETSTTSGLPLVAIARPPYRAGTGSVFPAWVKRFGESSAPGEPAGAPSNGSTEPSAVVRVLKRERLSPPSPNLIGHL